MIGKILEGINVEVENINALDNTDKVDEYEVCSTPTLIFLDDNENEYARISGVTTKKKIQEIIESKV